MIHKDILQTLTEDEHLLLWSIASHTFGQLGMEVKSNWIQMLKPEVVCQILPKVNIKEEYIVVRDGLLSKLNNGGGF